MVDLDASLAMLAQRFASTYVHIFPFIFTCAHVFLLNRARRGGRPSHRIPRPRPKPQARPSVARSGVQQHGMRRVGEISPGSGSE